MVAEARNPSDVADRATRAETPADGHVLGMLIPEFPSQTHAFFWREVNALRDAGLTVHLLSTRRPPADACRHDFADEARRQTHYLFPPRLGSTAAQILAHPIRAARAAAYVAGLRQSTPRQRAKLLALLPSAADLVAFCRSRRVAHVHCHSFADAAHLCAIARILGGPTYSLMLHGDLPVYGRDHAAKLRRCAAVTTAGPHLVEPVAALGYDRLRIFSNPMGVDTARFSPAPPRPTGHDALRLITVARLNANKGHRFALEAMAELMADGIELSYTIVGEGPNRASIEADIARLDLAGRANLVGGRGENEVLELLRAHDVFLLPSVGLGEAAPVSVMEAMSCGLPVVASIIGATPAMIRDGRNGFLTPQGDVTAIAQAIRALGNDPALRQSMSCAVRAHALEHFDFRTSARRLFEHILRCTPESFAF